MEYCCKKCGCKVNSKVDNCPKCGADWSQFEDCSKSSCKKHSCGCGC